MKAMVVKEPKAVLDFEDRPVLEPGVGEVRIRVRACGICLGDVAVWEGSYPYTNFATYPRVPGHEIAGVVEAVGEGVVRLQERDRVGLPWLYSACGHCWACRRGDAVYCRDTEVTGVTRDGGFQETMIAPAASLSLLPKGLDFADAGPLMCAGLTVFHGLRAGNYRAGDKVAVLGLGGLGHLGVLYAKAMGARVAVVSSHAEKEEEARSMGAELFIDGRAEEVGKRLQEWDGGADVILSTAPSAAPITAAFPGLAQRGTLVVLGASPDDIAIKPGQLINGGRVLTGLTTGSPEDIRLALEFAVANDLRPLLTRFPLDRAEEALVRLKEGTIRGRAVLLME